MSWDVMEFPVIPTEKSGQRGGFNCTNNTVKTPFFQIKKKGGPQGDFKYLVMETHYHNPSFIKSILYLSFFTLF